LTSRDISLDTNSVRSTKQITKKQSPLHSNEVPQNQWNIISLNLIGLLPASKEYAGIMVVVDRFSKIA